jgi:hypothetical protein
MIGVYPHLIVKKYIRSTTVSAEADLQRLLQTGLPTLSLSSWPPATADDSDRETFGYWVDGFDNKLTASYFGSRASTLGNYLYFCIRFNAAEYSSRSMIEIPFVRRIAEASVIEDGVVLIGQTDADLRSLGVVAGRRSEIFLHLLGEIKRFADRFLSDKAGKSFIQFPSDEFLRVVRKAIESDELVVVKNSDRRRFVLGCFQEMERRTSKEEFEQRFSGFGIKWPKSILFGIIKCL